MVIRARRPSPAQRDREPTVSDDNHCRHCGRAVGPSAQYCAGCGRPVRGTGLPTMSVPAAAAYPPIEDELEPFEPDDYPRRRVAPFVVTAIVVIAAIVAAGVMMHSHSSSHTSVTAATRPSGPVVMPSVMTFTRSQALTELRDAGVDAARIQIALRPRQDVAPGTVLQQHPAPGITVTGRVVLIVSRAPATMPNFVGSGINSARATLSTLGISLTMNVELNSTVADGTVLRQTPAPGTPFTSAVELVVARTPVVTDLGDLAAIGAAPQQSDTATIAGTVYPDSLTWSASVCPGALPVDVAFALGGHYRELSAYAGLATGTANPTDRMHLDVRVDGTIVLAHDLDAQAPVPIVLDVTKHQRIDFAFTPVATTAPGTPGAPGGPGGPKCEDNTVVLGTAHLLSTVGEVTAPSAP
jgi:hypothetical protein